MRYRIEMSPLITVNINFETVHVENQIMRVNARSTNRKFRGHLPVQ